MNPFRIFERHPPPVPTEDEILAYAAQIEALVATFRLGESFRMGSTPTVIQRIISAAQRIEYDRANEKAQKLLAAHLTAEQRRDLNRRGSFIVQGKNTRYQINGDGQIFALHPGSSKSYLCTGPVEAIPRADRALAAKLYIEANEEDFLKVANVEGAHDLKLDVHGDIWRRGKKVTPAEVAARALVAPGLDEALAGLREQLQQATTPLVDLLRRDDETTPRYIVRTPPTTTTAITHRWTED